MLRSQNEFVAQRAGLEGVAIGAAQTFTPARDAYYFDTLFSFMIYKMDYTHGRHDMLVVNELQQLLFSAYGGGAPNVDFGVMRIKNFDFVGSYTGFQQLELTNTSDNELEAQGLKGTMGMVFKKANPIWAVLAVLPDTAITATLTGGGNAFGPVIDMVQTGLAGATRFVKSIQWSSGADPLTLEGLRATNDNIQSTTEVSDARIAA